MNTNIKNQTILEWGIVKIENELILLYVDADGTQLRLGKIILKDLGKTMNIDIPLNKLMNTRFPDALEIYDKLKEQQKGEALKNG